MRQHDGPADGAGERIAEAAVIRRPAGGAGIGEEGIRIGPQVVQSSTQRTIEANDQAGDDDDPQQGDEQQALNGICHSGGFDAAHADEDGHDQADHDNGHAVVDGAVGGVLSSLGNGNQNGCDVGEGSGQEEDAQDGAQDRALEPLIIEVSRSDKFAVLGLVDDPNLVHGEMRHNGEQGDVAHLRDPVAQTAAIVGAGTGKEDPGAHQRGHIGHDQNGPGHRGFQQAATGGLTLFLLGDIDCHSQQEDHITRKCDPDRR